MDSDSDISDLTITGTKKRFSTDIVNKFFNTK
jgi:hypothetical protein